MKISNNCIELVKKYEGCKLTAYKCPAGVWTIGFGHTGKVNGVPVGSGMKITQAEAVNILKQDLERFEAKVQKYDSKYHWNQNEFDALTSFAFNVGSIDQLTGMGVRNRNEIAAAITRYSKANGETLPGLLRRREEEKALFIKPVKKVDDEMIEKSKMIINGKTVEVERILKNGTNYVKVRDVANALGLEISAQGNIPVLKTK